MARTKLDPSTRIIETFLTLSEADADRLVQFLAATRRGMKRGSAAARSVTSGRQRSPKSPPEAQPAPVAAPASVPRPAPVLRRRPRTSDGPGLQAEVGEE